REKRDGVSVRSREIPVARGERKRRKSGNGPQPWLQNVAAAICVIMQAVTVKEPGGRSESRVPRNSVRFFRSFVLSKGGLIGVEEGSMMEQ
ncbi:hypothetical protein GWI33_009612, partial [Rhynchophorus ferrugineus]